MPNERTIRDAKDTLERGIAGLTQLFVQIRGDLLGLEELLVSKGIVNSIELDTAHKAGRRRLAEAAYHGEAWRVALLADDPTPEKPS